MTTVIFSTMETVPKGVLKAKMLQYFRQVEESGEDLIVTDHGRPVVRVSAIRPKVSAASLFADVRGRVKYRGDLLAPTMAEWPDL